MSFKEAIEQLRLSIVAPLSQFCGTEITTTEDGETVFSNVDIEIPGSDIDYLDVEVRDLANNRGGYYGVAVSVGCGDPDAYEEIFSNRDSALAFIRKQIEWQVIKDDSKQ